jgi:hypothetical protein
MTDMMFSRMDGSANIRSIATSISRSLLGSSGASRSTIPTPGKLIYWRIANSITSSTVTVPVTEEGSAAPTAGEGSGTSAGEGTGADVIATS